MLRMIWHQSPLGFGTKVGQFHGCGDVSLKNGLKFLKTRQAKVLRKPDKAGGMYITPFCNLCG